jgi:hypothetical protein
VEVAFVRRGRQKGPQHRPLVAAVVFACALGVFALGTNQLVGLARCEVFARRVEALDSKLTQSNASVASWSFAFGDQACTVEVPIYQSELDAANKIDTRAVYKSGGKLREDYIVRLAKAQSSSGFIERLASRLREIKRERGLSDDGYLELMVRAVQSIPFGSQEARMRLPVEVVSSGYGVCSEKSFLLAALMLHEGYDTSFWVLETQNHVAPGVAVEGPDFRDSGYAFIETTRLAFIGEVSDADRAAGPIARPPRLIRLGGQKRYTMGEKVAYVLEELERAERMDETLTRYISLIDSMPLGSRPMLDVARAEQQVVRQRIAFLRGQTDEPAAAYAFLTEQSERFPLLREGDVPGPATSAVP